jgi:hypothetical protein
LAPKIARSYTTRFFIWGDAKAKVYENNPHTLDELEAAIIQYSHSIRQQDLVKLFNNKIKPVDE